MLHLFEHAVFVKQILHVVPLDTTLGALSGAILETLAHVKVLTVFVRVLKVAQVDCGPTYSA